MIGTPAKRVSVALPRPHSDGQYEIVTSPYSIALLAGRRWGKTLAGVERLLRFAADWPGLYWWVGLSWKSASMKRAWNLLRYFGRRVWKASEQDYSRAFREVQKEVLLPNGAEIWLRTAEKPESLAGEGVRGVVVDEFPLMRESVWAEYLEPTLLDFQAWALLMGVPKGENWAARLWHQAAGREGWIQRKYTTYDNPYLDRATIDDIRANTPAVIFEQEYLAEIRGGGEVFRNLDGCVYGPLGTYAPAKRGEYVAAVDWAQTKDYTVVGVMETESRALVDFDRFHRLPWEVMRDRVVNMVTKWGAVRLLPEANSIGAPNIEALQKDPRLQGVAVEPFYTTADSKTEAVQALMHAFETGQVAIPDDPVLLGELRSFEAKRLASGKFRYEAASGSHDDCVIMLMIAHHAITYKPFWIL